ncbi:expansin-like B1 [Impatiens glandulifera]|uniref:expansin-like B1 n=1 Tax=Impatiens glandulifera TaxID=253017 RepID=UPI001FB158D6|nr:expansin-like B1 [Impatiens glandulifera]
MSFPTRNYYSLLCALTLLPALSYCQDYFVPSRASYYGSPDCLGNPTGACGYGEYGRTINVANVAGVSRLWRNGTGCGACYQVRCRVPNHCSDDGINVVVTDYGEGDRTDFILSTRAYGRLARPNSAAELFSYGVVDIEYKRVPCQYPGYNLLIKVKQQSKFPNYLAIVILYQAGSYDITSVEVWQEDCKEWKGMRRAYGTVWDIVTPPTGAMNFRVQVSGGDGMKWVTINKGIPNDWKAGVVYDTSVQL